jgi:hypothetical protein
MLDAKPLGEPIISQVPLTAEGTDMRVMVSPRFKSEVRLLLLAEPNRCGGIERRVRVDHNTGPGYDRDPNPD